MAVVNAQSVCEVVSHVLHKTVKDTIRHRLHELLDKDIEPLLEEYTRQIIMQVVELQDPTSVDGLKVHVNFKLRESA